PGEAGQGRGNGGPGGADGHRSLVARLLQRAYLDGPAIVHDVEPAGDAREPEPGAAGDGTGELAAPGRELGERAGKAALPPGEALPGEVAAGTGRDGGEAAAGGPPAAGGDGAPGGAGGTAMGSERFRLPPIELLTRGRAAPSARFQREVAEKAAILEETLASFGVQARIADVSVGPAVTRFEVEPARGVKVSKIQALASDIALSLAVPDVRIEAPIPGKAAVGIEVPNREIVAVQLRDVLETPEFARSRSHLTVALGKDIAGQPVITSLDKLVHLLIAGATGSGKSVCINALIASLLFKARPDEVKLLLIDPKVVELSAYNGIPHLIAPVITDARKAAGALQWAVREMERRYELFARCGVRDIARYNLRAAQTGEERLPFLVVVIDELADLMMVAPVEVEDAIQRLAQMARASGIHLVVATQRPSVDVITGVIKANIPSRIAFAVSSQTDSRVILDLAGAEKLVGKGDMLFMPLGATKPLRVQGAYISERDLEAVLRFLRDQGEPRYDQEVVRAEVEVAEPTSAQEDDDLFTEAVRVVLEAGQASVSLIQRRLRVGYTRAGRLIDMMEERGYIGPHQGAKPRDVLITWEEFRRRHGDAAAGPGPGTGAPARD
ncbi:MAG: cell division protein FtsK, partial [Bacillota bacterium]